MARNFAIASLLALLAVGGARAVPLAGGGETVTDDSPTGQTGSVGLSGGPYQASGSVGQNATQGASDGADTSEAGYFSRMVSTPATPSVIEVSSTSLGYSFSGAGNPSATVYVVELSTSPGFSPLAQSSSTLAAPVFFTGLDPQATYYLTAYATYMEGDQSPDAVAVSTRTPASSPGSAGCSVYATSTGTVLSCLFSFGEMTLTVPPGALSVPATVSAVSTTSFAPAYSPAESLAATGAGVSLIENAAETPNRPLSLCLGYSGTTYESDPRQGDLLLAQYNTSGVWTPLTSTVDTAAKTVCAQADRFSPVELMLGSPAQSLAQATVFPNPFRPALGHTVITFANLPANATVRIYDLLGEKVRELDADAAGMASWDGRNSNGSNCASGVYFALAGSGGSRATLKVAIQR